MAPSSSGRTSPSVGSHSSFNFRGVGEEDIFRATEAEATSVVNHLVAESRQSQQGSTPTYEPQPDILQVQDTFEMEQYQSPPAGSGGAVQQGAPTATSSPETSGGSSGTSGNGNGREQPRLVVIRQPPTHIISNEWFEMEIGFEFPPGNTPQSSEVGIIEFVPSLHNHDPPEMGPSAEPVSLGARLDIGGQGIIQVSLRPSSPKKPASQRRVHVPDNAKDPSRSSTKVLLMVDTKIRQDRPSLYSIKFVAKRGQNLPAYARSLQSQTIFTRPITIVSARLKVDPIDWEPTWYKDEGGREKCMQVRVTLSDKNGDPVGGRKIPLKFTLLYDNGQSLRVLNQDILKVFGSGRQYMNPNASPVVISFRIEDVSKNHQGMAFKLEIAPDSLRTASDIAPGISPPVSIRSKRNKRQRSSGSSFAAARTGSAGSESFRDTHTSTMASSAAGVVGVSAAVPQHQQYQAPTMAGVSDIQALRAAMRGVIRWTEEVVNGLYPLKWQVIGYAQFPDGTVDYNRPYHSMPNPNECIQRVLSMYSDETRENLRTLLEAVENTTAVQAGQGAPDPGPRAPSAASAAGTSGATADATASSASTVARATPSQTSMAMQPYSPYNAQQSGQTFYPSPPDHVPQWQHHQQTPFAYPPPPYPIQHGSSPVDMPHPSKASFFPPDLSRNVSATKDSDSRPQSSRTSSRQGSIGIAEPMATSVRDEPTRDDIFYILAKPFKSVSTGEKLGFPCYNSKKDMIGFVRESNEKGFGQFVSITSYSSEFGPMELAQATRILEGAITNQNPALHSREAYASVYSLIDHALVYDYSRKESSRKR